MQLDTSSPLTSGFRPVPFRSGSIISNRGFASSLCIEVRAFTRVVRATMHSADFCIPIPSPLDAGNSRQICRSPRVRQVTSTLIPTVFTPLHPGLVLNFEEYDLHPSGMPPVRFLFVGSALFLRLPSDPPHGWHPCLWLTVPPGGPLGDLNPLAPCHAKHTTKKKPTILVGFSSGSCEKA